MPNPTNAVILKVIYKNKTVFSVHTHAIPTFSED